MNEYLGSSTRHVAEAATLLALLLPFLVTFVVLRSRRLRSRGANPWPLVGIEAGIAVSATMLVGGTLIGSGGGGRQLDLDLWQTTWSSTFSRRLFLTNLTMFLPLGFLLSLRGASLVWFVLPVALEAGQFVSGQGRVASVEDVWTNSCGLAAGWVLGRAVSRWRPLRDNQTGAIDSPT